MVSQVLNEQHPTSQFPDQEYQTFNEYFRKKYDLEIYNQGQPLLEVEYTSKYESLLSLPISNLASLSRLNLLLPRIRARRTSRHSRDPSSNPLAPSQKQILVPELLDKHPKSARLWHSIAALPSFFYRLVARRLLLK